MIEETIILPREDVANLCNITNSLSDDNYFSSTQEYVDYYEEKYSDWKLITTETIYADQGFVTERFVIQTGNDKYVPIYCIDIDYSYYDEGYNLEEGDQKLTLCWPKPIMQYKTKEEIGILNEDTTKHLVPTPDDEIPSTGHEVNN